MSESSNDKKDVQSEETPIHQKEKEAVHSANDWEHADLGGDDRRQKFLRLMGAGKKQHSGRFVIGGSVTDHHGTTAADSQHKEGGLEYQFREGLDHKLSGGVRRHHGFGFHEEENEDKDTDVKRCRDRSRSPVGKESPDTTTKTKPDSSDNTEDKSTEDKLSDSTHNETSTKSFYRSFVKSGDS